jgi:hypothetical protein
LNHKEPFDWFHECKADSEFFRCLEVIMERELTNQDYAHSVKIGSVVGFLVGWAIGAALILYLDNAALYQWAGLPHIPLWMGIGWALYGFIVGGGGIFANVGRKTVTAPAELKRLAKAA